MAKSLAVEGQPRKALELIYDLRGVDDEGVRRLRPDDHGASCNDERVEALRRIAVGERLAATIPLARELDALAKDSDDVAVTTAPPGEDESEELARKRADLEGRLAVIDDATPSDDFNCGRQPTQVELEEALTKGESEALLTAAARACDEAAIPDPAERTGSQEVQTAWTSFMDDHIKPLGDPLVGALTALAGAVVLSLLLTWPLGWLTTWFFIGRKKSPRTEKIPPWVNAWRAPVMTFGLALLIVTVLSLLFREVDSAPWWLVAVLLLWGFVVAWALFRGVSSLPTPGRFGTAVVALLAAAAIVLSLTPFVLWGPLLSLALGAAAIGWALSQARRISIRVANAKGGDDANAAAHIAADIRELSGADLKGVETPAPADDSLLQEAGLTTTPEGKVAGAAYKLLELLVPRTPWVVRVHAESEDVHSVTVLHHGRVVRADVIDRDLLGLRVPVKNTADEVVKREDKPVLPDLHRLCAAVAVAALAERYEMPGLAGARAWQGIGLHFVAKTDLRHGEERGAVLDRALRLDPDNRAVLLEYWHHRFRRSEDPEELRLYADFLASYQKLPGVTPSLKVRASHSRYVALVNRMFAIPERPSGETITEVRLAIWAAAIEADNLDATGTDNVLALRAQASLEPALEWSKPEFETPRPIVSAWGPRLWPPGASYSWACYHATVGNTGDAVRHLRAADGAPKLASWRAEDPQLKALRETDDYHRAFGRAPKAALLDVQRLEPHVDALKRIGATTTGALLSHNPTSLARVLQTTEGQAREVQAIAALAESVPGYLDAWRFELADLLSDRGVLSVQPGTQGELVPPLIEAMEGSLAETPPETQLKAWLGPAPPQDEATDAP